MTQVESYSPRRARRASHSSSDPQPAEPPRRSLQSYRAAVPIDPGTLRGRHSTTLGQGFSWVIGWTIVAALVPGAGLAAAGWRKLGGVLLALQGLAVLGLVGLVLSGNSFEEALSVAVDPDKLLIAAAAVAVLALAWIGFLLLTSVSLRRYATLTGSQRAFSALVTLALVGGIVLPAYKGGSYALIQRDLIGTVFAKTGSGTAPATAKADPWANIPRMNVLLIGSDAGSDREGVRTDTLILASINTKNGNTVLFSLPRNLGHAQFPLGSPGARRWPSGFTCPTGATDECMINAVWQWGESAEGKQYYPGKHSGLKATEDAVAGSLGINVDNYALLSIQGLVDFVDAIGGVRVNISQDLPRGGKRDAVAGTFEYTQPTQGYLKKGKNKLLDGYNAMWYARSRRQSTDYDRMERQRCLIGAITQQSDPVKVGLAFPKIAKAVKNNLSTSIGQNDLQAWVDLAMRIQKGKTTSLAFTDQVLTSRENPDYALIHKLVNRSLRSSDKVAGATPSTDPSATPGTTPRPKKLDPTKAQDVKALC